MYISLKKIAGASILSATLAGSAQANTFAFEDMIDLWDHDGSVPLHTDINWRAGTTYGAANITEDMPLSYTHDINDSVDLANGDLVTEAYLELDFTNDFTDAIFFWDFREYAQVAYDGSSWVDLGEVDDGAYELVLDIDWLNDDGFLDVTIAVNNPHGTATAWLDHSRLYGLAETATVPEPSSLALMGLGLLGVAGVRARKNKV